MTHNTVRQYCCPSATAALFVLLLTTFVANARAGTIVVPNGLDATDGNSLGAPVATPTGPFRVQEIIDASQFPQHAILITGFKGRPDASQASPGTVTYSDIQIHLSTTTQTVVGYSATFADNVGPDDAVVFSGPYSVSTANLPGPGNTKQFDLVLTLTTPFLYNPSQGNLLIDNFVASCTFDNLTQDSVSNNPYVTSMGAFGADPAIGIVQAGFGPVNEFIFQSVPEPSTVTLLGIGATMLAAVARRRSRLQGA